MPVFRTRVTERKFSMKLTPFPLDATHHALVGTLPPALAGVDFEALWALHPNDYHVIHLMGRPVATPRWQTAFGHDYRYTGALNPGLPMPPILEPFLAAAQGVDARINGLLLNWYDGDLGHYIGKHRDSVIGLVSSAPIITFSLGAKRTFRFRKYRGPGIIDLDTAKAPVIAFDFEVNRVFSHEVPKGTGRRISVTARAFNDPTPT